MGNSEKGSQAQGSAAKSQDETSSSARKAKPGLAIYRPGSGPLRRTNPVVDRRNDEGDKCSSSSDKDSSASYGGERNRPSSKHRNKKPQQAFYMPKPLADRLKRKSLSQADLNKTQSSDSHRSIRQGSEPRIIPSGHPLDRIPMLDINDRRIRDSRSVEPNSLQCNDSNLTENRSPINRNHSVLEKSSLSTTGARPEEHASSTPTQAVDEWDGNTLTFVGRCQVNVQADAVHLHQTSDIAVGLCESEQTEGTHPQKSVSPSVRVPVKDENQRDGDDLSQPSTPSGGRGVYHGQLSMVNGSGRSRGRLLPGDLTGDYLPGGLKGLSGLESSPSASHEIHADESPVIARPDKNNKMSHVSPFKLSTVDQNSIAPLSSCHKSGDGDDVSNLSKPLDWSEEVEKAMSKTANEEETADQQETKSGHSEKANGGSTSSRDGRQRRRRNRQSRERSKDRAHVYRSVSNDRSSCSSSRFGQQCSSEENWDDPIVNMQTASGMKKLGSDSREGKTSHLKKRDVGSSADRSGTKFDEHLKQTVKSIDNSKYECDNRALRNKLGNRVSGTESHHRPESQKKFNSSGSNERHRASSDDRYRAHSYNRDRFQRAGSRDRVTHFGEKDKYSLCDSVDRWPHDLFKTRSSESETQTKDRGRSYSRERYNRSGSQERQLYDPNRDCFSRGMDSAGRYKRENRNTMSRKAPNLETTSGGVNTGFSIRSYSRERFKGTSRYPNTASLDRSRSKQSTDRDCPEESVAHDSKLEHSYEGPKSVKSDNERFFEFSRRDYIRDEHKDNKTEGRRGSLVTTSACVKGNEDKSEVLSSLESTSRSGIIILPAKVEESLQDTSKESAESFAKPILQEVSSHAPVQKHLYDPNNPNKPIPVVASGSRACRSESKQEIPPPYSDPEVHSTNSLEMASCWNLGDNSVPGWLNSSDPRSHAINAPRLVIDTDSVVRELLWYINNGSVTRDWKHILGLRALLENLLSKFLKKDLKFCARENVEKYLWTVTTHKLIERLRELMNFDPGRKEVYKAKMLVLIESDTEHLEKLVRELEEVYHFRIETFLSPPVPAEKRDGNIGLALISVQKIYLFLGDLARYKEEVNQSTNYGKCRQWYLKAHLIDPRNGLPYNQLAVIAVLARRKLDAVYYYMRSIMASNTVLTAREKIVILFDEARRKYEMLERKRREENPPVDDLKEKESRMGLQREFWIHPQAGVPRLHITTSAVPELLRDIYRQEDELRKLDSVELNKRFIISYINVQGKLYTKVGMDSFQETAVYMLLEFRALIQHKPLPLNVLRFLQLLALNMFSLHTSKLRQRTDVRYRPVFQENALIVALQMFNLILERCNSLLRDQLDAGERPRYLVPEDMITLLPAIKVWCDWMLCHVKTWNPPPSCSDFQVGPPEDVWERFATFINLLEQLYIPGSLLLETPVKGCDLVRLPEDSTLCHFKPLFGKTEDENFYAKDDDMEVAYVALRIRKILFFGTVFLCGIEPPVLKLHHSSQDTTKYISVVESRLRLHELQSTSDIRLESFSEDEDEGEVNPEEAERRATIVREALKHEGGETLTLLRRREELERDLERHKIIVQEVLKNSQVYIEIDVKPRILIPDTNTFIDHLASLRKILGIKNGSDYLYTFGVPLVVFRELEGLSLGGRFCDYIKPDKLEHIEVVAEAAKDALLFLRSKHPRIRCFTTRGTMIPISSCVMNEDSDEFTCNDDRILATAVSLIATSDGDNVDEGNVVESANPRRVLREVVLLTEDRCLRMKAMLKLVPTRDIPDFVKWAGLS
ncbi:telomerase-binding protein EST1A [Anabrus simplex]|uniref:telomerase-binding protein EST1A n=1 Tax=Anabrus simplex TaxID=316456 RepID=UPI0035A2F40B